jgi:hypothetical protein
MLVKGVGGRVVALLGVPPGQVRPRLLAVHRPHTQSVPGGRSRPQSHT